jgi:hypothetical protein
MPLAPKVKPLLPEQIEEYGDAMRIRNFDLLPAWIQSYLTEVHPYAFTATYPIDVEKHLKGKHDQSTHANGARDFSASPKDFFAAVKNPELTPDQIKAVELYMAGNSAQMNAVLSGKKEGGAHLQKPINDLRAAIDKADGLAEETTLYSAVRTDFHTGEDRLAGLKIGDVVAKKGFISTTASQEFAERWVQDSWKPEAGFVFKLTAPKGTKGIAPATAVSGYRSFENEYEFLMSDNQSIEITNIDYDNRIVEGVVLVGS